MTTDAVIQIIQTIQSQLSQSQASALSSSATLLSQVDTVVGLAANYAQLLGTAAGPIAQAAVANTLAGIAAEQATLTTLAGSDAEAAALAAGYGADAAASAGALATGVGAAIVLVISAVLALLSNTSGQSDSSETQLLNQLTTIVNDIQNTVLASYWQDKITTIMTFWTSPTGGLGTDLDNLANEGTGGTDVKQDVSHFHDHALGFVNLFIPARNPGAEIFWERPVVQDQLFVTTTYAWYTNNFPVSANPPSPYPLPEPAPSLGGSSQQMVSDPRSMLPYLLLGINSYLTLQSLVNFIDSTQPTFSQFVSEFQADLQEYVNFIQSQYNLATNGIVKREVPDTESLFSSILVYIGASNYVSTEIWNGFFGVVDTYPPYGVYQPAPPVTMNADADAGFLTSSPSYLLESITNLNIDAFLEANGNNYESEAIMATGWTAPWLQNKLILRMMAQWKAIYLLNCYDKVWSILQKLGSLINQSLPPLMLNQDGTIASGNWSVRELCKILNVSGDILNGVQGSSLGAPLVFPFNWPPSVPIPVMDTGGYGPFPGQYSLFSLAQCLDNIAIGTWVPPSYSKGSAPSRPLGLRERLAAAASNKNL
jgi:hypothetical protein